MNGSRLRAMIAVGVLGVALGAAPASAQVLEGCGFSECSANEERPPGTVVNNPGEAAEGEGSTTTTLVDELPGTEEQNPVEQNPVEQAAGPAGELPFTGGDVAGLALIGAAAIGTGAILVRRSRTAKA